jgi:hypothetical protein
MKFDICVFVENVSRKFKFHKNLTRTTSTLHEDVYYTFMIISRWILLRTRNISNKHCREDQNTHFIFNKFFEKSCHLWDNVEKYGTARQATADNIIWRMRFACWITKATDTHSECLILFLFHGKNCYKNAPHSYVKLTLYVLSKSGKVVSIPLAVMLIGATLKASLLREQHYCSNGH